MGWWLVGGVVVLWVLRRGVRRSARALDAREATRRVVAAQPADLAVEVEEAERGRPRLVTVDPGLPGAVWIGSPGGSGVAHGSRIYTRDDDFDRMVAVHGMPPHRIYALLDEATREAVFRLVIRDGELSRGRLTVPVHDAEVSDTEGWARTHLTALEDAARALRVAAAAPEETQLLRGLRDDSAPGYRHQCLLMLLDGPKAAEAVALGIADDDPEVRLRAARHAGDEGLPVLRAAAAHADPYVRGEAYDHLGHCAPEALRAELAALLDGGPEAVAAPYARPALAAALRFAVSELPLHRWVLHDDARVAQDATQLLALHGRLDGLLVALGSTHVAVIQTAALALGERGGPAELGPMAAGQARRSRFAAGQVEQAMKHIRARHAGQSGGLAMAEGDGRLSVAEGGGLSPTGEEG